MGRTPKLFMNKKLLIRATIPSGILGSAALIIYFFTFYLAQIPYLDKIYNLEFWIPLPIIIVSIYYYRKAAGELRFWQGFLVGYLVNIIMLFTYIIFLVLMFCVFDEAFLSKSISAFIAEKHSERELILKSGWSEEEFNNLLKIAKNTTISSIVQGKIIVLSIAGLIYTVILSMLFRK